MNSADMNQETMTSSAYADILQRIEAALDASSAPAAAQPM